MLNVSMLPGVSGRSACQHHIKRSSFMYFTNKITLEMLMNISWVSFTYSEEAIQFYLGNKSEVFVLGPVSNH